MSGYVYGSSSIGQAAASGPLGPTGATGITGTTGPIGPGTTGATGISGDLIVGLTYDNRSITFKFEDKNATVIGSTGFRYSSVEVSGPVGPSDVPIVVNFTDAGTRARIFLPSPVAGKTGYFKTLTLSGNASFTGDPANGLKPPADSADTINIYGAEGNFIGATGQLVFVPKEGGQSAEGFDFSLYTQDTGHSGSDDNLTINVAPLYEFLSGNRNFQGPNANKIGYEFPSLIGGSGGFGKTRTVFQDQFGIRFPSLNIGLTGNGLDDINYFTPYTAPSEDPDRWKKYDGLAEYGSCCYCTDVDDGNFEGACTDYITKAYCDEIGGNFLADTTCLNRLTGANCAAQGTCCINGTSVNSTSRICDEFRGVFFPNQTPDEVECPDRCEVGACCVNGVCYTFNRNECDLAGGTFYEGETCRTFNCCLQDFYKGACCVGRVCSPDITPFECSEIGGVFQGNGSLCENIDCCLQGEAPPPSVPPCKCCEFNNGNETFRLSVPGGADCSVLANELTNRGIGNPDPIITFVSETEGPCRYNGTNGNQLACPTGIAYNIYFDGFLEAYYPGYDCPIYGCTTVGAPNYCSIATESGGDCGIGACEITLGGRTFGPTCFAKSLEDPNQQVTDCDDLCPTAGCSVPVPGPVSYETVCPIAAADGSGVIYYTNPYNPSDPSVFVDLDGNATSTSVSLVEVVDFSSLHTLIVNGSLATGYILNTSCAAPPISSSIPDENSVTGFRCISGNREGQDTPLEGGGQDFIGGDGGNGLCDDYCAFCENSCTDNSGPQPFAPPQNERRNPEAERSLCALNVNPTTYLKPGDEFGGGILLGVIGEPNDYGSIVAKGEAPYCLTHGYGSQCPVCPSGSGSTARTFVLNAGNNYFGEINGPCSCDSVTPYKYVPQDFVSDPSGYPDVPHSPYNLNLHELPIKRQLASTNSYEEIKRYYSVASSYYSDGRAPRKWALVIAPEDLSYNDSKTLSWGLRQAAFDGGSSDPVEDGKFMGTPYLDGLLGTRMFDRSSYDWMPWFIEDMMGRDDAAYDRWSHEKTDVWGPDVDIEKLKTDKEYFKQEFEKLWEKDNKENAIMRLISDWNTDGKFGYNDWYVPSIVELMYLYGNLNIINSSLLRSGMTPLTETSYWSSTTGAKTTAVAPNGCIGANYRPLDPQEFILESKNSVVASHAHRAFTQNFRSGLVSSEFRIEKIAAARPVRRIPLFDTDFNCQLNNHLARYVGNNNGDCYNCQTCNCGDNYFNGTQINTSRGNINNGTARPSTGSPMSGGSPMGGGSSMGGSSSSGY